MITTIILKTIAVILGLFSIAAAYELRHAVDNGQRQAAMGIRFLMFTMFIISMILAMI